MLRKCDVSKIRRDGVAAYGKVLLEDTNVRAARRSLHLKDESLCERRGTCEITESKWEQAQKEVDAVGGELYFPEGEKA